MGWRFLIQVRFRKCIYNVYLTDTNLGQLDIHIRGLVLVWNMLCLKHVIESEKNRIKRIQSCILFCLNALVHILVSQPCECESICI